MRITIGLAALVPALVVASILVPMALRENELPPGWKMKTSSIGRVKLFQPNGSEVFWTFDSKSVAVQFAHYCEKENRREAGETWSEAK
jgi:hypothetical protein